MLRRTRKEVEAVSGVSFEHRARRAVRPARPQRRRQDDHDQDADHPAAADAARRGCSATTWSTTCARCAAASATSSAATAASTSGSSALDNLRYFSELYGVAPARAEATRIDELLELVGLTGRERERVEGYSRGMRQRLHIARGLLHDPDVLFLDEPSIGIDPVGRPRAARDHRRAVASRARPCC